MNRHRQYNLTMFVPPGDFNLTLGGQCVDSDGTTTPFMVPLAPAFPFGSSIGLIVKGEMQDEKTTTMTIGPTTFTYTRFYHLHAAPYP